MQIGLESDPWGARSGAAGTLWGHSPPQACRQARSAPPASSAAFPQQRRVRLQSTKKKELSSIKKDPFRGLLLCSRCLPLHDLRAEHYALVYSVSSQYVQDRLLYLLPYARFLSSNAWIKVTTTSWQGVGIPNRLPVSTTEPLMVSTSLRTPCFTSA